MIRAVEQVRASVSAFRARRRARRQEKLEESLAQRGPDGLHVGSGAHDGPAMSRYDSGSAG